MSCYFLSITSKEGPLGVVKIEAESEPEVITYKMPEDDLNDQDLLLDHYYTSNELQENLGYHTSGKLTNEERVAIEYRRRAEL